MFNYVGPVLFFFRIWPAVFFEFVTLFFFKFVPLFFLSLARALFLFGGPGDVVQPGAEEGAGADGFGHGRQPEVGAAQPCMPKAVEGEAVVTNINMFNRLCSLRFILTCLIDYVH